MLRTARKAAGLTQAELARSAGTRQGAISAYETGRRDPTVGTLKRLLRATGHDLEIDVAPLGDSYTSLRATELGRIVHENRAEIRRIVAGHGGGAVGVFGSVARGENLGDSDLDILIQLPARTSMFTIGAIAREVEKIVGVEVDVVPEIALRPDSRDRILAEVIEL